MVLWKCKGQKYLTPLMMELASEVLVFFTWFPRKSEVGGKQRSDADVRWYTSNLGSKMDRMVQNIYTSNPLPPHENPPLSHLSLTGFCTANYIILWFSHLINRNYHTLKEFSTLELFYNLGFEGHRPFTVNDPSHSIYLIF